MIGLKRWVRVFALVGIAVVAAAGGALAAVDSYDATDLELVETFLRLLQARDREGLAEFLSPHFILTRADGSLAGKEDYLENPAVIDEYIVSNIISRDLGDVRVVRYDLASVEWIDGVELPKDPAVRLSVFHWNGEQWQLLVHANFLNFRSEE